MQTSMLIAHTKKCWVKRHFSMLSQKNKNNLVKNDQFRCGSDMRQKHAAKILYKEVAYLLQTPPIISVIVDSRTNF